MYARIQACVASTILLFVLCLPVFARESVSNGKIMMVVENQMAVREMPKQGLRHFDISRASIYRNGLLVSADQLGSGDWVTVTAEKKDGRLVATLVEAASDHSN